MNRRKFLQVGAAGLALSALPGYGVDFADQKKRVGVIVWLFLLSAVFWSGFEQAGTEKGADGPGPEGLLFGRRVDLDVGVCHLGILLAGG